MNFQTSFFLRAAVVVIFSFSILACGSDDSPKTVDGDVDSTDDIETLQEQEPEEEEVCGEDECCLRDARYIDNKPLAGETSTACLRDMNCEEIMVICHRGFNLEAPENSVPGIQAAIDVGCDVIEADVRETIDGALVLMHDDTVDRTTDGSGSVAEMTLDEIMALHIEYDGESTELKVPTFAQLLDMTSGKTLVYIDWKDTDPQGLSDLLVEKNAVDRVLVYASNRERLDQLHTVNPNILILPKIEMDEPDVAAVLQRFDTTIVEMPSMVANGRAELIAKVHAAGGKVNQDQLGAPDIAAEFTCDAGLWQQGITDGLDAMQTDIAHLLLPVAKGW